MLSFALVFIIISGISFAGSLQLGIVNLKVIQTAVYQGFKPALLVAVGGCLPEMLYSALAVWFAQYIDAGWFFYLEIVLIPLLFFWGLYQVLKSKKVEIVLKKNSVNISLGFGLAMLNPQLFPFWLIIWVYIHSFDFLNLELFHNQVAFVLASSFGAFGLLFSLAWLVSRNKNFIDILRQWNMNRIVGAILIGLSLLQLIYMVQK